MRIDHSLRLGPNCPIEMLQRRIRCCAQRVANRGCIANNELQGCSTMNIMRFHKHISAMSVILLTMRLAAAICGLEMSPSGSSLLRPDVWRFIQTQVEHTGAASLNPPRRSAKVKPIRVAKLWPTRCRSLRDHLESRTQQPSTRLTGRSGLLPSPPRTTPKRPSSP